MDNERMFELAEKLRGLREDKAAAEANLKEIKEDLENTAYQLSELMASTETQNFTRAGLTFYLTTQIRASQMADNKEGLYAALRKEGFGDLVYETVNANSLSAFVKEQMGENGEALPQWLDGLVNVYEKSTVGVRKAK